VGIRSQVQRLSRPHRGDRRSRRRRRGQRGPGETVPANGDAAEISPNGSEPMPERAEVEPMPSMNGAAEPEPAPQPAASDSPTESE